MRKRGFGNIEFGLIIAAVIAVAVLFMFNMTISKSLIRWQAVKTCFYIGHHMAGPPTFAEKGVVASGALDFLDSDDFHKLNVFAILYNAETGQVVGEKWQDMSYYDSTQLMNINPQEVYRDFALQILDSAASGESEKIKLPKGGVGEFDIYNQKLYIYTLPVAIGENENSRSMGYLMVGANIRPEPTEELRLLFCRMVELTGAQVEVYGEECGLTGAVS